MSPSLGSLSPPLSLLSFSGPTVFAWRKVAGQVLIEWLARFEPLPVTLAAHASTSRIPALAQLLVVER
jgi:hypothetical protein